jgi:hypothetical protein
MYFVVYFNYLFLCYYAYLLKMLSALFLEICSKTDTIFQYSRLIRTRNKPP